MCSYLRPRWASVRGKTGYRIVQPTLLVPRGCGNMSPRSVAATAATMAARNNVSREEVVDV